MNKRTARLSANIPLVKNNLAPLSFNEIEQDDYISSMLAIYEHQQIQPLAELYTWSYLRSCKQYQNLAEDIGIDVMYVRYRQLRRQLIAQLIIEKSSGTNMQQRIHAFTKDNIPATDHEVFIAQIKHELAHLERFKLPGLGVSQQQFEIWKLLQ